MVKKNKSNCSRNEKSLNGLIVVVLTALTLVSLTYSQETITVLEFQGKNVSQTEASALTDQFEIELSNFTKFTILERQEAKALLEEVAYQQSGCVTSECAVEIGKQLGAKKIVLGSISKVGSTYLVTAKVVDIKTTRLEGTASITHKGQIDYFLTEGMTILAKELVAEESIKTEDVITKKETQQIIDEKVKFRTLMLMMLMKIRVLML